MKEEARRTFWQPLQYLVLAAEPMGVRFSLQLLHVLYHVVESLGKNWI
jgi:hypothetical protein